MSNLKDLYLNISMLSVFHSLKSQPLFLHFLDFCSAKEQGDMVKAYSNMLAEIYREGGSLTDLVRRMVFEDECVYIKMRAEGKSVPEVISDAVEHELDVIGKFASLSSNDFMDILSIDYLPSFNSEKCDLCAEYETRIKDIKRYGYGIFASHPMFRVDAKGDITPVLSADTVSLDSFIGYESERAAVVENTLDFIGGKPAANVLLYGDAGTGKSSTVKAVVNQYYDSGLRLVELRKDQLGLLPYVLGRIRGNPLKFIIFIDDLSFNNNDDNFSMLKAALEGSASAREGNAVIYATSNRRHIVRESFDDRGGDDVHRNDTMQEQLSLSARFGLSVMFQRPSKQLYLSIIHSLAERYGISCDQTELDIRAEEFALRKGSRSPRCAEQFIKSLL